MNFIKYLDYNTLFFIQNHVQNDFVNPIIIFFTKLGNSGFIWILISIILIMKSKYRKIGFLVLSVLFINTLFGEILLKHLIQRPRPFITLSNLNIIIEKPSSFSFPSGHTSSAFACAFIFGYFFKKYKWYFYSLAFIISFSRIYLLVHYPSDVICGIFLGYFSFLITKILYLNFIKHKNSLSAKRHSKRL